MLFQKIRPKTLNEFVGNKPAATALKRAIEAKDRSHCYLFVGPSGCGKTTLARIVATEFGAGESSVIEINAASQRGIDMARELEKFTRASPFDGGCWAVIIDECHSLTKDA